MTAVSVARAEATKNGYTSGVSGYTVTPVQDPASRRRLMVSISGSVGTYFANVLGVHSFPATRQAKAEFVLPVPMGSPQACYGVGFFQGLDINTTYDVDNTGGHMPATADSGGGWSNESLAHSGFGPS